ncbi:uncharacterized protein LOC144632586 isoform X2 [Oculina patagonica]
MLDQTTIVKCYAAFIFVLLLASAKLASANPICAGCGNNTADSPSKKVVDFNVQISESGAQYNETIEVDTEKQTELFKVPAHNSVEHSNILHDFKTNMSMILLPEKKVCYVLPLEKSVLTPKQLLSDLDKAERADSKITETRIIENKWIIDREMTDRSVLSDELANFCAKYPMYYVKKLEDYLKTTRIQTGGEKNRNRRQVVTAPGYPILEPAILCSGGKSTVTPSDYGWCTVFQKPNTWKLKCKVYIDTCYEIVVCPLWDPCYKDHLINRSYCCEYLCM